MIKWTKEKIKKDIKERSWAYEQSLLEAKIRIIRSGECSHCGWSISLSCEMCEHKYKNQETIWCNPTGGHFCFKCKTKRYTLMKREVDDEKK